MRRKSPHCEFGDEIGLSQFVLQLYLIVPLEINFTPLYFEKMGVGFRITASRPIANSESKLGSVSSTSNFTQLYFDMFHVFSLPYPLPTRISRPPPPDDVTFEKMSGRRRKNASFSLGPGTWKNFELLYKSL